MTQHQQRLTPEQIAHGLAVLNARPAGPGTWLGQLSTGDLVIIRDPHQQEEPMATNQHPTSQHEQASRARAYDGPTCAYPGDQEHDHEMCHDAVADATRTDHQNWTSESPPSQAATCEDTDDDAWEPW